MTRARAILLGLAALAFAGTADAQQLCRQALAFGLDVSGSVDDGEYRMQLDGLAAALTTPEVVHALLDAPGPPARLAAFEWSAPSHTRLLVDWIAITDRATLDQVVTRLRETVRIKAPPGTAVGSAMLHGAGLLAQQSDCWRRTLDLSGDGKQNMGPHPRDVKTSLAASGLTINALAVGADAPAATDTRQLSLAELVAYFDAWVILGPDAFVEAAVGYDAYQAAMTRKLLRELQSAALASLPSDQDRSGATRDRVRSLR